MRMMNNTIMILKGYSKYWIAQWPEIRRPQTILEESFRESKTMKSFLNPIRKTNFV